MKPWQVKGWVIPPKQNAHFVADMERVLDVYKRPYCSKHPVVCMDESPKQLIGEIKQFIRCKDGSKIEDYEYKRNGVCNIFMANEPLSGKRMVKVTERKTKKDWRPRADREHAQIRLRRRNTDPEPPSLRSCGRNGAWA